MDWQSFAIGLLAGLVIGGICGLLTLAMCVVAKRADGDDNA